MKDALTARTERVYHQKLMWTPCACIAEVVDQQLEYGLGVEAMMPQRPGGEDWVAGLYAGFFGGGGSIARNPISRQLFAPPEAAPKFWELLTWKLSWVEDYSQYNTTSEA